MLKRTSFVSRLGMCLTFNKGKEGLITCMQRGNVSLLKTTGINFWWKIAATGPCYHNRSLMGRGKAREKILHELLTRCPGSFCLVRSTDVMGTSKYLSVFVILLPTSCASKTRKVSDHQLTKVNSVTAYQTPWPLALSS